MMNIKVDDVDRYAKFSIIMLMTSALILMCLEFLVLNFWISIWFDNYLSVASLLVCVWLETRNAWTSL